MRRRDGLPQRSRPPRERAPHRSPPRSPSQQLRAEIASGATTLVTHADGLLLSQQLESEGVGVGARGGFGGGGGGFPAARWASPTTTAPSPMAHPLAAHSPEQQRQLAPLGGLVWSKRQPTTRFLEALQQRALHRTRQWVPSIGSDRACRRLLSAY